MIGWNFAAGSVPLPSRVPSERALKAVASAVERRLGLHVQWDGERRLSFKLGLLKQIFWPQALQNLPFSRGATLSAKDGRIAFSLDQKIVQGTVLAWVFLWPLYWVFSEQGTLTMLLMAETIVIGFGMSVVAALIARRAFAQFIERHVED